MASVSEDFKTKMTEWVELKQQLKTIKEDVKVLTDKEKLLKEFIGTYMKDNKIDNVNLRKGKVSLKQTTRKGGFTRHAVENGIHQYFDGDDTKVETLMNFILDSIHEKTTESVNLTGIKN
tara:strand:+ start:24 stop:383 length:360 start_codon:yes stop_codon:yes gene_type:complete